MAPSERRHDGRAVRGDGSDRAPALAVRSVVVGEEAVLVLDGEADRFSCPLLAQRIEEALDAGARRIVIDLADARFVDSSILLRLAIVGRGLQSEGGWVTAVSASPVVGRICEVLALGDAIRVVSR